MSEQFERYPLFSIIVPVFNVADCLARCLDSVLSQTFRNIEVILIDDGSEDDSGAICDQYAQCDNRVRIVHQKNGGLSTARNTGIDMARGKYVIFVDSDDWVEMFMCEALSRLTVYGADVITTLMLPQSPRRGIACKAVENHGTISGRELLESALEARRFSVTVWRYICRTEFLKESNLRFKEGVLYEDLQFTPRMLATANSVTLGAPPYYHRERRLKSITLDSRLNAKAARDLYETCMELEELFEPMGVNVIIPLGDLLVHFYLVAFKRAPKVLVSLDGGGKEYVKKRLTTDADRMTFLSAKLFLFSPAIFSLLAKVYTNLERQIIRYRLRSNIKLFG